MQAQWLTHVITYNSLISAFTKGKFYETMQSQRLTQVITYNTLISAFVKANPYETMQSEWLTPVIVCSSTLPRNITDAPLPILIIPPIFSGGSLNALTRVLVLSCLLWTGTGVSAGIAAPFFPFLLFQFFCRASQVGALWQFGCLTCAARSCTLTEPTALCA
jgi:hypothetical protein